MTQLTHAHTPFEYLIFDLDGVLIDSSPCHQAAYQALWNVLGLAGPEYKDIAGKRTIEVVAAVTLSLAPTKRDIDEWVQFKQKKARQEMERSLRVFPGVIGIINKLRNEGINMSLATGASRETALLALNRMGLDDCFDFVVTANDVSRGKPDPSVFREVLMKNDISPERNLIVEDSISGVEAALAAGCCVCTVHSCVRVDSDLFMGAFSDLNEALTELGVLY